MITPLASGTCCSASAKLSSRAISSSQFKSPNSSNLRGVVGETEPFANSVGEIRKTTTTNLISRDIDNASLNPIRNKDICLARLCVVAIRSEHQLLSIGREHGETIEGVVVSDALQAGAVHVYLVEIEIATFWIGGVRRKKNAFAVGEEIRCEAGLVQVRHLPLVRSVRIHHPDIQHGRANQILFQQLNIFGFLFFRLRMISAIDDLLAVIR